MTVLTVVLLAVIVALIVVIGMLLGSGPRSRRAGVIDLTPAAARGELDLDWSDPRDRAGIMSSAEQDELVADFARRYDAHRTRLTASSA